MLSLKSLERYRQSEKLIPIAISFFEEPLVSAIHSIEPPVASANAAPIEQIDSKGASETIERQNEQNASGALSVADLNAIFAPAPIVTGGAAAIESPERNEPRTAIAAELGDLYGVMLYELTPQEREFLEQNLNPIQTITQRYLWQRGYPALAVSKGMQGEVILGFTLMQNGDITPIEIIKSSGWSLLDDHAVDTIRVAYKDYPRPSEPVRVRMRVIYRL